MAYYNDRKHVSASKQDYAWIKDHHMVRLGATTNRLSTKWDSALDKHHPSRNSVGFFHCYLKLLHILWLESLSNDLPLRFLESRAIFRQ